MSRAKANQTARRARRGITVSFDAVRATEYDDDGFLGVQLDSDGVVNDNALEPQTTYHEAIQPLGIAARSPEAELDAEGNVVRAGQTITFWEGSEAFCLQVGDPRLIPGLATLRPGEAQLYGPAFNYTRCHADGRVSTMTTTDGTANGRTIVSEVGPAGFTRHSPWATFRDDATGFHWRGRSGARLDIGGITFDGPLSALNDLGLGSYGILEANILEFKGKTVQLGVGSFEPAVKALAMLTVLGADATDAAAQATALSAVALALTALQAAVLALHVDVSGLLGGPQNTASAGPVGAVQPLTIAASAAIGVSVTATSAFTAACTAATQTIPASCCQVA